MIRVLSAATMVFMLACFVYAQGYLIPPRGLAQHDFSVTYSNGATAFQGCRGCHVPHGGAIYGDTTEPQRDTVFGPVASAGDFTTGQNRLWDKLISTEVYATYSSDNIDLPGSMMTPPSTAIDSAWHSYLCFSCHDGAVASLNIPTGLVATDNFLMNGGNGDVDLTNDHPVDIAWPTTVNAPRYAIPVNNGIPAYNSVTQILPLYGTSNKVECASCHNPHEQAPVSSPEYRGNFLRMTLVGDNENLCRACHLAMR